MAEDAENPPSPDELSYEQALDELETIIEAIEAGEVGLEESLARYRRGAQLLTRCRSILRRAEQELEQLGADDSEPGQP
jgi:exodeoxyribonuclease VII small subunit